MTDLISIIIPVYNSEKYLDRCLNSLLEQDYPNIEIILVDNGSSDGSLKICEKYKKKNKQIKVFQRIEGYQGAARNFGILKSSGEYLMFVDSDDYVTNNFCSKSLKAIKREKADIAIFDYCVIKNNNLISKKIFQITPKYVTKELVVKSLTYESFLWNKIFKKKLFEGISFPEKEKFEDIGTVYKLIDRATKIIYIPISLYFYNNRIDSTVYDYSNIDDYFINTLKLCSFIKNKYLPLYESQSIQLFLMEVALFYYSKSSRKNQNLKIKALNILNRSSIIPESLSYHSRVLLFTIRKAPRLADLLLNIKNGGL